MTYVTKVVLLKILRIIYEMDHCGIAKKKLMWEEVSTFIGNSCILPCLAIYNEVKYEKTIYFTLVINLVFFCNRGIGHDYANRPF